jgi:hypothetical protein
MRTAWRKMIALIVLTWGSTGRGVEAIPAEHDQAWPPPWFGSIQSARTDTAARTEDILRAGFGRDDHLPRE